jgi:putative transposase
LNYKTEWLGKKVLKIGRFEPSSKLCSVCGYKNKELTLKDRMWICPECETEHDRDVNAAINIRNIGLNTSGTAGFKACGESVSLVFSKAVLCEAGSPHFKTVSQV